MSKYNVGDYFLNSDHYLCKIIDINEESPDSTRYHVHIIDTNHFPIMYEENLKVCVFKHLGNNEKVAQTLYKLNDEEIARREKYERRVYLGKFDVVPMPVFTSDDEDSSN